MTSIRDILQGLAGVQSQLRISQPVATGIKRVWSYPPDRKVMLPDTPCWVNTWDLVRIERKLAGGAITAYYQITADLFVDDADLSRASEIASAFMSPYIVALNRNITLGGTVNQSDLRGGSPTLALLEWGGKGYPGLHTLLEVQTMEGVQFA